MPCIEPSWAAPIGRGAVIFLPSHSGTAARARFLARRLPPLTGPPIRLLQREGLRDRGRSVHASAFLRERSIAFNCPAPEFPRIFVHEIFHFAWLRLGNPRRLSYEAILWREFAAGACGELGWSAEWRKQRLTASHLERRTRVWREYCCESFCDTAAWIYSGIERHREFTLAARYRLRRRDWFARITGAPLLV